MMKSGNVLVAGLTVLAAMLVLGSQCPGELTKPVVRIVAPGDYDTLNWGIINVKAHATDNKAMHSVSFYVDDEFKDEVTDGAADTFRYTWHAYEEEPGVFHVIRATARDASGNMAFDSVTIWLRPGGFDRVRSAEEAQPWDLLDVGLGGSSGDSLSEN